ncbi:hypothetical protein GCM10010464_04280 [Pseudonocardia yunnanensis]
MLDLRRDTDIPTAVGRRIKSECDGLKLADSFLVVIGARGEWISGADDLMQGIRRPDPIGIIRKRLTENDNPLGIDPAVYLDDARVQSRLLSATPTEAVQWFEAIVQVHSAELDAESSVSLDSEAEIITQRRDMLIEMRSSWRDNLSKWHRQPQIDSRHRNFLLAAAVLEGQPVGNVFEAALDVATKLGEPDPEAAGQQGPGIIELTDIIDADLDGADRVQFRKPDYAAAAIDYFWLDRQHLRKDFVKWLATLPLNREEPREIASRAAHYILRSAVRQRSIKDVREVVLSWSTMSDLHDAAADLILAATLEGDLARAMTDQTLNWARSGEKEVQLVLAKVCGGQYARVRPTAALLRLANLAESTHEVVVRAVIESIANLWASEQLRGRILSTVQQWCEPGSRALRRKAGASAFLSLAGYTREDGRSNLFAEAMSSAVHRGLAELGWGTVLDVAAPGFALESSARRVLSLWLNDALLAEIQRDIISDVLVAAVRGENQMMHGAAMRATHLTRLLYEHPPSDQGHGGAGALAELKASIHFRAVDSLSRYALRALLPTAPTPGVESGVVT